MGTRVISKEFQFYQRKRNLILFSFLMMGVMILISIFLPIIFSLNTDILFTIYLVILLILAAYIMIIKPLFTTYSMYYHFYRMLDDQMPPQTTIRSPFEPSFVEEITKLGLQKVIDRSTYTIYAALQTSLPWIRRVGPTLVMVLVGHSPTTELYSPAMDEDIQLIKTQLEGKKVILNQVMIQFKSINDLHITPQMEFNQIINYAENNRATIQIPVAYHATSKKAYFLRPASQYPNKFYYFAARLIEQLLMITKDTSQ